MRIRSHLVLLFASALIPALIGSGFALDHVREKARESALRALEETVRATALVVDGEAQRAIGSLTALAQSSDLSSANFEAFYDQAKAINRSDVWTLLLDENGQQIINTILPYGGKLPPPTARDRVKKVLASGQPLITDLILGPATGKLITTIYIPVPAKGKQPPYVVAQAFSAEHWKKRVQETSPRPDWIVSVIDRKGKFISRSERADELLGKPARPELYEAAVAHRSGMIRHKTLEGVEVYHAFAKGELTGWTISVAAPVKAIESSAIQGAIPMALGLLVALFAGIISMSILGSALLSDVRKAIDAARALGQGEMPPKATSSLLELNALHASLRNAGRLLGAERGARSAAEAERARLLDNEREARESAQEQNAAKDTFLAMLGHELRNPLAAISGATEVLARRNLDEQNQRFLEIARRQNTHLSRIVNDLLDASRMLTGKLALETHPLNLTLSVSSCVEAFQATQAGQGVTLDLDPEILWARGDAVRIEQILSNLITNAIKFSPPDSPVLVSLRLVNGQARLEVSDLGDGIDPAILPRIFEPFVQGRALAGRPASGLGIGLALARQLTKLHGGSCEAGPNSIGIGTTLTVTLPLISAPATQDTPLSAVSSHLGAHILLVEDNLDAREAMGTLLSMLGYQISEAEDGASAIRALQAQAPDAIVMDLGLPGRGGHEIAREIRANPAWAKIPMIALSGYGQESDRAQSLAAGFNAHLAKPASADTVALEIERLLHALRPSKDCPSGPTSI